MTMTDPLADMLTRIRNANTAMHDDVVMPSSKLKESLAGLLQAPTRLSPRNDLAAAEQRRRLVLEAMFEQGYLSEADHEREAARHLWLPEQGARPSSAVTVLSPRPLKGASADSPGRRPRDRRSHGGGRRAPAGDDGHHAGAQDDDF